MMQWQQLLIRQRLGKDNSVDSESVRSCFQRDYDRLVFSSPFRRLKDKTQVYSLAENDYLRTRLIHSIEVSSEPLRAINRRGFWLEVRHSLSLGSICIEQLSG